MASLKMWQNWQRISDDGFTGAEQPGTSENPETLARVGLRLSRPTTSPDLSAKKIRGRARHANTIGVLALDTVTTPFSVEIALSIERPPARTAGTASWWNMFSDDSPSHRRPAAFPPS